MYAICKGDMLVKGQDVRNTVKLYESSKRVHSDESQEAWEHERIVLKPLNPEYENITVSDDLEGLCVIAEFLEVLGR